MGLSDSGSYALVFVVTFLLVAALTLVTAKIFDRTPALPGSQAGRPYAPAFPDVYPLLPPPPSDPARTGAATCVAYCASGTTGVMGPCESVALRKCTTPGDCEKDCAELPANKYQDIQCLAPADAGWPTVAAEQKAINNASAKYCLPQRVSCTSQLTQCSGETDCLRCNDELPNQESFACKAYRKGADVPLGDQIVTAPETAAYCVPAYRGCDARYGIATRSDKGWVCECKYPGVYGGPACNELVACNARELTPWSRDKQKLLLNMPGQNGSLAKVGDEWTIDSNVDPNKCIDAQGKQVECNSASAVQPTVSCRCDGIQEGTFATYTFHDANHLMCKQDPCYATGARTGKTWLYDPAPGTGKDQLPAIPHMPASVGKPCACSGFGSSVWAFEPTDQYDPQQGYKWRGYCKDVAVPSSSIVIKADADKSYCDTVAQANTVKGTDVVPSVNALFQSVCTIDPCSGKFADSAYKTLVNLGSFDAASGKCTCSAEQGAVEISIPPETCNRTLFPTCSTCANACIGGKDNMDKLCPVQPGSSCITDCKTGPKGERICECAGAPGTTDCFWYDGMCRPQVENMQCCGEYHGTGTFPNLGMCTTGTCRVVRSQSAGPFSDCSYNAPHFIQQAVVCSKHQTCGEKGFWKCNVETTCKCGDAPGCTTSHFNNLSQCGETNPRVTCAAHATKDECFSQVDCMWCDNSQCRHVSQLTTDPENIPLPGNCEINKK